MIIFEIAFWGSITLLVNVFLFYPLTIYLLSIFYRKEVVKNSYEPTVSVIVAAFNEEGIIEGKIQNCLSLDYTNKDIEVIVVSDGSTDNTNGIIKKYDSLGLVKGIVLGKNQGKTTAVNEAVNVSTGDYLVFTDANVILDKKSIKQLMANFSDKDIGCVCGQLNYYNLDISEAANTGGIYWRYEEFIKKCESITGSTMGADGSLFAIRKELFSNLKPYLIDDFSTSMNTLFKGYRIVFESKAKAFEKHTTSLRDEITRRRRIANRVFTAILYYKKDFLKLGLIDKYKFIMHKLVRYLSGFLMLIALFANFILALNFEFYQSMLFVQIGFYLFALIGFLVEKMGKQIKVFYIPYYFFIMNFVQQLGVVDTIKGNKQVTWNTKNSSR